MNHVKFLPWVGAQYIHGIRGRKVMALGESHYCKSPIEAVPEITINAVKDFINPNSEFHDDYKKTYTKFERALAGKVISSEERKKLWNSILFYNYVQVPKSEPRERRPKTQDYTISEEAFFEVLEKYRPDCVIVWGKDLYNNLPQKGKQKDDLIISTGDSYETWAYNTTNGHEVQLLYIYHPASGFSWDYWHEVIMKFLERN